MRTMKALLVTAAVGAVGIATSMADPVYSANVVGFVNVTLPEGWHAIANPLNGTNNTLNTVFTSGLVDGAQFYKWDADSQTYQGPSGFLFGEWDLNFTMNPGDGGFIQNPGPGDMTITFVGEVPQGNLSTTLKPNWNLVGSQVPQSGGVSTTLGYVPADGDQAYTWDKVNQNWVGPSGAIFGEWDTEPTLGLAESFFLFRDPAFGTGAWTRTFNVQ